MTKETTMEKGTMNERIIHGDNTQEGDIVSTIPSFLNFKFGENVSDGTCEDVLDGVDVGGSEKQEMEVGSNIAFEEDAKSTKNEDLSGQLNMNSQIEGFKVP